MAAWDITADGGSSPLTRGKLTCACVVSCIFGLIPTHAGKTPITCATFSMQRAHPHSRGENAFAFCVCCSVEGSSPLTRGKRALQGKAAALAGLIPTHAGKTERGRGCPRRAEAHPHSRGENCHQRTDAGRQRGSSPLTRGKLETEQMKTASDGLIPTHAGKTVALYGATRALGAHPHSRGENAAIAASDATDKGSSPLTRGKPLRLALCRSLRGLIPTHAGKTRGIPSPVRR